MTTFAAYEDNVGCVEIAYTLYAKRSKCKLDLEEVDYLGHFISANDVKCVPSKVSVMLEWLIRNVVKALR